MRDWLSFFRNWSHAICVLCGQHTIASNRTQYVLPACARCLGIIPTDPRRCPICAIPQASGEVCGGCLKDPPSFKQTITGFDYAPPFDHMIQAIKFAGEFAYIPFFAQTILCRLQTQSDIDFKSCTGLVAVPLSTTRWRERGYNQAERLARAISQLSGLPLLHAVIDKVRDSPPQASLSRSARLASLRHTFELHQDANIHGAKLLVVDDVMTTGNTLEQVAKTLKAGGAEQIVNLVATRTSMQP